LDELCDGPFVILRREFETNICLTKTLYKAIIHHDQVKQYNKLINICEPLGDSPNDLDRMLAIAGKVLSN